MEAKFECMMSRNLELENKIQNQITHQLTSTEKAQKQDKKNILASDASSQAQQLDPKRQDLKATP